MIQRAVEILRRGGLVAFPTETVYGLGADATNAAAIEKIFAVKGRPTTNPLICHVADTSIARRYAACWPTIAAKLAEQFWPGPLTIVLPAAASIVSSVRAGRATVGLRVPNHSLTLELLRAFDGAMAGPSANRSNHVSPTTAQHVRDDLGDDVELILDGGPCDVGIESTVLDISGKTPVILRPGGISRAEIQTVVGEVAVFSGQIEASESAVSPGQQPIHYAPQTRCVRCIQCAKRYGRVILQWPSNDPAECAQFFYAELRRLDRMNADEIAIRLPPDEPRWTALRDRIIRATVDALE